MPIPKPKNDEDHDEFMDRCMGDDVMNDEYPDGKQRAAVCEQQWKDKDKKTMNQEKELRFIPFEDFELREETNKPPRLIGYASVFGKKADIFGLWLEQVAQGAFKKTIKENDIRALWNHNTDLVLGRNKAGTLALSEDEKGLKAEIIPPDTQAGRDAMTSIRRGDVSQMSISFQAIKQEWFYPENKTEMPVRTIKEAKLFEVSPVTFPAFEATSISARSGLLLPDGEIDPLEEARRLLRCAERGMNLTSEQRKILSAAVELYQPYLLEPGPDSGDHSGAGIEPELEGHYSALERMRRLENLSREYGLPL
jgi:HK97 family phage prohead protease